MTVKTFVLKVAENGALCSRRHKNRVPLSYPTAESNSVERIPVEESIE